MLLQAAQTPPLGLRIYGRECVVEDEDSRAAYECARDRRALFLPARQRDAAFPHKGLEAVGELLDVVEQLGLVRRTFDVRRRRVGFAERDVVGGGVGGEEDFLRKDRKSTRLNS